jgi:hypothetical protein
MPRLKTILHAWQTMDGNRMGVHRLRARSKINSQILSVEAPAGQGAKAQEYKAYSELSQRRQAGCIDA